MPNTLWNLEQDECGEIACLSASGAMRRRLMDLGFIEGMPVKKLLRSRGIAAYLICGTLIALRQDDAMDILMK